MELIDNVEYSTHEVFGLKMPNSCPNVPSEVLHPKNTWKNKQAYDKKAYNLAKQFVNNFKQFESNANAEILAAAPKLRETSKV